MTPARQVGKKKYVVCGLSNRAIAQYILPLVDGMRGADQGGFAEYGSLAGILDVDQERVRAFSGQQGLSTPSYAPSAFDQMLAETRPDVVIVAGPDSTHAEYIIRALQHDLDVITEKPMVVNCEQARAVIAAEAQSRGRVRVTHNERYTRAHMQIKRMLQQGLLGRITNVELVFNIDTYHGSSYFYRWNRDREQSGGMTITKGCHHYDLINWWLDDVPQQVFAYGALNFYGANSPYRPVKEDGSQYSVAEQKRRCPYYQRWLQPDPNISVDDHLLPIQRAFDLPYHVQYPEDRNIYIYDEQIAIEDTYSAVVRYRRGTSMSYTANYSAPWEGYVMGINGTKGRIETTRYTNPERCPFPTDGQQTISYYPLFGERQVIVPPQVEGSHGGADPLLRHELFVGSSPQSEELGQPASALDGAYAVAVGEAIWRSVEENRPIDIAELLPPAHV